MGLIYSSREETVGLVYSSCEETVGLVYSSREGTTAWFTAVDRLSVINGRYSFLPYSYRQ